MNYTSGTAAADVTMLCLLQPAPAPSQRRATSSPDLPGPPAAAAPPAGRAVKSAALAAAFRDDEEEDKPKRRLVPLQYTPQELAAARVRNNSSGSGNYRSCV